MNPEEKSKMLNDLVENALDFLANALEEIKEGEAKYSILHFYAAVELFIKARLMMEHWSLIITKGDEPDWDKFVTGDFRSVSLDDAANRLKKVVRDGLLDEEMKAFKNVARHRNKFAHFFHADHQRNDSDSMSSIVGEQLKAWYFLHRILTTRWKDEFAFWNGEIAELNRKLMQLREFLRAKYDALQPKIREMNSRGVIFTGCPSCGFEAQENDSSEKVIYESTCLVCNLTEKKLHIACPSCGETVSFAGDGFSACRSCGKDFEPPDVADVICDSDSEYIAITDGGRLPRGNCSDCEVYEYTVVPEGDEWVCAGCFERFESLDTCGWCNELNTGDLEMSSVFGCSHCPGSNAWNKDN